MLCIVAWCAAPAFGGTALSAQINAEAHYVAAYGYMVRSVAEARKINAEAVAQEIQNSVDYVKAYYERRHIYEEEYRKKHPDAITVENRRQKMLKERVEKQYQAIMRGGDRSMTDMLNWLLQELSSSVMSLQYVLDEKGLPQSQADVKLSQQELRLLRLTDGGHAGSRLVFAASDGKILLPKWPLALRGHECDAARDDFDRTRDAVVKDVQATTKISPENQAKLMRAVNGLYAALDAAYPSEVRKNPQEFLDYSAGKRFIQGLVAAAHRAITINDATVFSGGNRFQGDNLFALVRHMHCNGLQFAPPEPGGERVYKTMFTNLRGMYVTLGREQPAANAKQPNAAAND
jgi:hypothetical protein